MDFQSFTKIHKMGFCLGVDYIHGEVMYVKRHAIHQIEGDDYRPFETHVFIPNSKKVCICFLYMFKVAVNVFSSYLLFIQFTTTEPIFGFFLKKSLFTVIVSLMNSLKNYECELEPNFQLLLAGG